METSSATERASLRIGLILGRRGITRYALDIVGQVQGLRGARIELVIREAQESPARSWFFRLYEAWDRRLVRVDRDPLEIVGAIAELGDVPEVALDNLREASVSRLDLLLDLRSESGGDGPLPMPPLGLWWLFHGPRSPAGFWELITGNPLTMVELRVTHKSSAHDRRLGYVAAATRPGLSWVRNRHALYRAAVTLVVQRLQQVQERGWQRVTDESPAYGETPGASTRSLPSNLEVVRWLIPAVLSKIVRRLGRRPMRAAWHLGMRRTDRPLTDGGARVRPQDFRWLAAPAGREYADPFLISHQDRLWCFFEDIEVATGRGRIAAAEMRPDQPTFDPVVVLERPYHLSYPCVFRDGTDLFMIPESSESGAIELYRCTRFPDTWKLERILMRETAVDTTICMHEGRYWLFTTRVDPGSQASELWLFFSESLTGVWTPHPQNPISLDVRNVRGAGAIVNRDGLLFRPSQDCSVRYGRRFSLNAIVTMTTDRFEERPVVTVEPMPGFVGTHSYAQAGSIEMIDGCVLA